MPVASFKISKELEKVHIKLSTKVKFKNNIDKNLINLGQSKFTQDDRDGITQKVYDIELKNIEDRYLKLTDIANSKDWNVMFFNKDNQNIPNNLDMNNINDRLKFIDIRKKSEIDALNNKTILNNLCLNQRALYQRAFCYSKQLNNNKYKTL